MNRQEIREAIHDLAQTAHMREYVIDQAVDRLDLHQLGELFDDVADHHAILHPPTSRRGRGDDATLRSVR